MIIRGNHASWSDVLTGEDRNVHQSASGTLEVASIMVPGSFNYTIVYISPLNYPMS